jgi:hypothetical protein
MNRTTTKPLVDCYRVVRIIGSTRMHALWEKEDKTMCGHVQALDAESAKGYSVSCGDCQKALKKERQRRSAEGVVRGEERRLAAHFRAESEPQPLGQAERHALTLARNLLKASVMNMPMFGKTVSACTFCLAVKQEENVVGQYEHEKDCPVILAEQVIENYGDRE